MNIINLTFETGIIPEQLDYCSAPIYEKENKPRISNYFKNVLHILTKGLDKINLLYENQYKFKKGINISNAIKDVCNEIIKP